MRNAETPAQQARALHLGTAPAGVRRRERHPPVAKTGMRRKTSESRLPAQAAEGSLGAAAHEATGFPQPTGLQRNAAHGARRKTVFKQGAVVSFRP